MKGFSALHFESEELWFVRVYLYWLKLQVDPSYDLRRENLCHFVRVVLLWAPITWFFEAGWGWKKIVRPVTVVVALMCAVLVYFRILIERGDNSIQSLTWILLFALWLYSGIVTGAAILGDPTRVKDHDFTWKVLLFTSPVYMAIVLVFLSVVYIGGKISDGLQNMEFGGGGIGRFFKAFFWQPIVWKVRPWMIVAVVAVTAVFTVYPDWLYQLLAAVIASIAILLVFGLFLFAGALAKEIISAVSRFLSGRASGIPLTRQVGATIRLGWEYLVTVKHKFFCPNIVFDFDAESIVENE